MTFENDGIVSKAKSAVDMYTNAQEREEIEISKLANEFGFFEKTKDIDDMGEANSSGTKYTLSYDANGGTGVPTNSTKNENVFTISNIIPKKS